jgi:hypothetical protein
MVQALEGLLDEHKGSLDIDALDAKQCSALEYSVLRRNMGAVRFLLKRGANPDGVEEDGPFPLLHAAGRDHPDVMYALIEAGARINQTRPRLEWPTALHGAALLGRAAAVRALLELGADAGIRDKEGKTAGEVAAQHNHTAVLAVFKEFATQPGGKGAPSSAKQPAVASSPAAKDGIASALARARLLRGSDPQVECRSQSRSTASGCSCLRGQDRSEADCSRRCN